MRSRLYFLIVVFLLGGQINYAQYFEWAKRIGPNLNVCGAYPRAIEIDKERNVYCAGSYNHATIDFDPGPGTYTVPINGAIPVFILKLDSSGNFKFVVTFGQSVTASSNINSIKIDTAGNIYTLGVFKGSSVDFDPGPGTAILSSTAAMYDLFINKLDSAGNFIWCKKISTNGADIADTASLDFDHEGNLIVTGRFQLTGDFDPGPSVFNVTSNGFNDVFVCKLDQAGNFIWAKTMGGVGNDYGNSLAVDSASNIYVTGQFRDTVDFDPGVANTNTISNGGADVFIWKLDSAGNYIWVRQIGNSINENSNCIAYDRNGFIAISGVFNGTVDFDPLGGVFNATTNGSYDIFYLKTDLQGTFSWVRTFGGPYWDTPNQFTFDQHGNLYCMGYFRGTVDFDPGLGTYNFTSSSSWYNFYLSKLSSSGNFVWAKQFSTPQYSNSMGPRLSIALDTALNIYSTGPFLTCDFDPGIGTYTMINKCSGGDMFALKLSQGNCSGISLGIDSALDVSCLQPGFGQAFVQGSSSPYFFQWNTNPVTLDSVAYFNGNGIYYVTYKDSNHCEIQNGLLINAPTSFGSFDLTSNLVSTALMSGFHSQFWLDVFNDGCTPQSGQLAFIQDTQSIFISSSPPPDLISGDTLFWNLPTMIYDSTHFIVHVVDSTSANAIIGDSLCFNLMVNPVFGDFDSSNNFKTYCFPVLNGYDPNIKSVYPTGVCPDHFVLQNQTLTYTIQFQNTGNSNAININVLDTVDADLDLNSVRVIAHSHPLITEVLPGNVLKFRFDSIMLPDSTSNELLSLGYVIYEIDPLPSLQENTEIKNGANIYFDFNPPINTNFVTNRVVSVIPACNLVTGTNQSQKSTFNIYPNPAKDFFTIENLPTNSIIKIYDFSGRLILTQKSNSTKSFINTNNLANGIFLVEVSDENSRSSQRIIINR